ncbi:23S rRNA (uridine(2479)-2'-O)-methyltransferase [mine drainage metagenome]|uniref:23S rRNA (Uridine(2479)-2'-O)-methyltransferase n=1 Tax=mine drainage metagenome TaxID=410659 RepID=A0A1J5QDJ9_9ZZZZ
MMPVLTNPRAERVKSVRALSGRSSRLRTGRFVVEGPQGVREAVREVPERIHDLYVTASGEARYPEILRAAHASGLRVHETSDEVLVAMSADAQGVLAVVAAAAPSLAGALDSRPRLVAILARVRDPGNAGAVIRAADAAGADLVILTSESVDLYNPKVVRATAGSLFHLPVVTGVSLEESVAAVRGAGLRVLAADGGGDLDLDALLDVAGGAGAATVPDLARPTAWVFGNEAWGLSDGDRSLADDVVRVPIHGRAESLNLATAATVCLYASARAHRSTPRSSAGAPDGRH